MKKNKKSDYDIKVLFSQLPKIKDRRKKEEIYARLLEPPRQKRKNKWIPVLVSVATLCLLAIISSTYFFEKNSTSTTEQAQDTAPRQLINSDENSEETEIITEQDVELNEASKTDNEEGKYLRSQDVNLASLLYETELVDSDYVTIGIPTKDVQYVVPLTFVYSNTMNYFDMFNEIANSVNEEDYGLDDYFPLQAEISFIEDQKVIGVNLPDDHTYVNADQIFQNVLEESFRYQNITEVQLKTEGERGVEFSHLGDIAEVKVTLYPQRAMYVATFGDSATSLFVPSERSFETFSEALEAMKEGTAFEGIQASIPKNVVFESIENDRKNVIVTFSEETILANNAQYEQAIEAILLTARDFGFESVSFQNSTVETIGAINMYQSVEVPVAPNVVKRSY